MSIRTANIINRAIGSKTKYRHSYVKLGTISIHSVMITVKNGMKPMARCLTTTLFYLRTL